MHHQQLIQIRSNNENIEQQPENFSIENLNKKGVPVQTPAIHKGIAVFAVLLLMPVVFLVADEPDANAKPAYPLSLKESSDLKKQLESQLTSLSTPAARASNSTNVHSQRGDTLFFLGRFKESVDEYQAMVELDPGLESSHWRLGIALFFADRPQDAVAQFEKYHAFDDVDRENGIWRYLSQFKATDAATAKKELLRYNKDDREPFPAVYKLFDESMTAAEALANIPDDVGDSEKEKRLFYTELYIGMHMVVKQKNNEAKTYLSRAVSRKWPRTAGFGPNYMWHVARVQLDELLKNKAADTGN